MEGIICDFTAVNPAGTKAILAYTSNTNIQWQFVFFTRVTLMQISPEVRAGV